MKHFALSLVAALALTLGSVAAHEGHDHSQDAKSAVKANAIDAKGAHAHGDKDCCKKGHDGKSAKSDCCKKHDAGHAQDCCKKDAKAKTGATEKRQHGTSACCKKAGTPEASACCKKHDAGIDQACCMKGLEKKS